MYLIVIYSTTDVVSIGDGFNLGKEHKKYQSHGAREIEGHSCCKYIIFISIYKETRCFLYLYRGPSMEVPIISR